MKLEIVTKRPTVTVFHGHGFLNLGKKECFASKQEVHCGSHLYTKL